MVSELGLLEKMTFSFCIFCIGGERGGTKQKNPQQILVLLQHFCFLLTLFPPQEERYEAHRSHMSSVDFSSKTQPREH